jgi:hypothetical protein
VKVIAVIDVGYVDVIGVVPVIRPGLGPRVNETDPIAVVLEAGISSNNKEGLVIDSELMSRSEISTVPVVGDAVPVVAAALLPIAMVGVPVM